MRSPGINGEGELRGQPANPGSPGKKAVKTECVKQSVCCLLGPFLCIVNFRWYVFCLLVVLVELSLLAK